MKQFDNYHDTDIILSPEEYQLLKSTAARLKRLQRIVGHGNFHLIGFDEALQFARSYSFIGAFPKKELDFLESIFYQDASMFGFLGEKPIQRMTERIRVDNVDKVPNTGHYLYQGSPMETYKKIKRELGNQVLLTSGVRGVIKQFYLFLNKAVSHDGNLSLASRSLAPPGYSFHGTGDFDVGQVGFGAENFTDRFTTTPVFKKLENLGYIKLRYVRNNLLGVRFEPWHIKVTPHA